MEGSQTLFSLGSAVMLLMGGVREALDEKTLQESQLCKLHVVYAALTTCVKEVTEIAIELDVAQDNEVDT